MAGFFSTIALAIYLFNGGTLIVDGHRVSLFRALTTYLALGLALGLFLGAFRHGLEKRSGAILAGAILGPFVYFGGVFGAFGKEILADPLVSSVAGVIFMLVGAAFGNRMWSARFDRINEKRNF
jgi:hypothetical protein